MRPGVAVTLLLALALAGCLAPKAALPWSVGAAPAAEPAQPWSPGSWWSYRATFASGRGIDVALVVHESSPAGYRLGTNLTAGFFGLPFNGTVTPGYNPVVAGEEWRLFDFPLADGKTWESQLMGYPVKTTARAAEVALPDGSRVAGYDLTSTSYGRVFARHAWAEETGWFTALSLYEPTDGTRLLDVRLTGAGSDFGRDYYVEVPIQTLRHEYPGLDGADALRMDSGDQIAATLTLRGTLGEFSARLLTPRGVPVLEASVRGQGAAVERATFSATEGTWTLDHLGLGQGALRLELTAIVRASDGAAAPAAGDVEAIDLAALLRAPGAPAATAPLAALAVTR